MTRKVLRFGAYVPLILQILGRFKGKDQPKSHQMIFWRTVSDLSLVIYFLTDHPLYFQKIGFTKFSKEFIKSVDYWNNIFWLANSVLDIICDLVELYAI